MMPKSWGRIEEMPHCFSTTSVKFQGHTGQKIADFDPNWAFPDCNFIARRHGHVFRMALHNEGDWRMETWQRARQGELSCLQTPIPESCNAILNTCQMPSRFYIIPFNVNKSQTHLSKSFIARNLMQAKHADVCSVVLFWTACTRRTHVLSLPSRCEKSDSWRQAGSVKTAKESWTLS